MGRTPRVILSTYYDEEFSLIQVGLCGKIGFVRAEGHLRTKLPRCGDVPLLRTASSTNGL